MRPPFASFSIVQQINKSIVFEGSSRDLEQTSSRPEIFDAETLQ